MFNDLAEKKEKKVEYIELIYDLIFVYVIGRNNALLQVVTGGFVDSRFFLAYVMTTLAVIQIWNYSTYYINVYGRYCIRDHLFLFVNMFLLYFVGEGTRADWQRFHTQYHVAWALILINIGLQYVIEWRNHKDEPANRKQITKMAVILFTEAAIVLLDIPAFRLTKTTWLSLAAILFGVAAVNLFGQRRTGDFVDFPHLSERAMLYVVFTFGEMIIGMAGYFDGEFSFRSTYFAFMGFLIVIGLFRAEVYAAARRYHLCNEQYYQRIVVHAAGGDPPGAEDHVSLGVVHPVFPVSVRPGTGACKREMPEVRSFLRDRCGAVGGVCRGYVPAQGLHAGQYRADSGIHFRDVLHDLSIWYVCGSGRCWTDRIRFCGGLLR